MAIQYKGYEVVNGVRVRTTNMSSAPVKKDTAPKNKKKATPSGANIVVEDPKEEDNEKDN